MALLYGGPLNAVFPPLICIAPFWVWEPPWFNRPRKLISDILFFILFFFFNSDVLHDKNCVSMKWSVEYVCYFLFDMRKSEGGVERDREIEER